jgi:hypothetical protein
VRKRHSVTRTGERKWVPGKTSPVSTLTLGQINGEGVAIQPRLRRRTFYAADRALSVVPASGVASVATAAEPRGRGLGRLVFGRLLPDARETGAAVISALFETTPAPYWGPGWEEVGALVYDTVPAWVPAEIRTDTKTTFRRAVGWTPSVVVGQLGGVLDIAGPVVGA